ncbi:DUF4145 domain-containing protein [Cupriavidus pauculus]|nr:DUF4145 domain-containing protein [Cupriavidus pauculus]
MFGESTVTDYPPAALRKPPKWMSRWFGPQGLKEPVRVICNEIYKALQNDMPHLAAMGVRAALEQAMIDKIGGDHRGFDENLEKLFQQGHVSLLMKKQLESVLDVGHATIHRGHIPSEEDLNVLVGVMEHVIESLYVHEEAVKRMAERTPPRPPRPAKVKGKPGDAVALPAAP